MFQSNDENYDFEQSYNLDINDYHHSFNDNFDSVDFLEKHRTTNDSQNQDDAPEPSFQQLKIKEVIEPAKRKINHIQIRMTEMVKFCDSKKGQKLDTLNLSKNVKTQTSNFLKLLILSKQTSIDQTQAIMNYNSKNGSLQSYDELFSFPKIKQKCLEFYSSRFFIQDVLSSSKMEFQNKIKYMETIKNMEEQKWNGKLVRSSISNSIQKNLCIYAKELTKLRIDELFMCSTKQNVFQKFFTSRLLYLYCGNQSFKVSCKKVEQFELIQEDKENKK